MAFFDVEPFRIERVATRDKWGRAWTEERKIPNMPAFLEDFAKKIGVSVPTIHRWEHKYPAFRSAYMDARARRQCMLCTNGLLGLFEYRSWAFTMKNLCGWTDRQDVTKSKDTFNVRMEAQ